MKKKRKKRKRNGGVNGGGGCWNIRRKTGRTSRIREGTKLGDQGRGGLNDQNSLLTFQLIFQRGGRGLDWNFGPRVTDSPFRLFPPLPQF